jgi:hypothetical protein
MSSTPGVPARYKIQIDDYLNSRIEWLVGRTWKVVVALETLTLGLLAYFGLSSHWSLTALQKESATLRSEMADVSKLVQGKKAELIMSF